MPWTRRRLIVTAVPIVAGGCVGRSTDAAEGGTGNPTTDRSPPVATTSEVPDDLRLDGGTPTVRFPDVADGSVSTSNGLLVEYASPVEANFDVAAIVEGSEVEAEPSSDALRVNRAIPAGGPPTVYPAPVYREGAGFEYRFYANEAFVEMHDWHVTAGTGNPFDDGEGVGSRAASFESHYEHVHLDAATAELVPAAEPDDPLSVTMLQYPFERLQSDRPDDLTGVVSFGRRGPRRTPIRAPQVSFSMERDGSSVVLTHRGGDALDADALEVRIDGTPTDAQWADRHARVQAGHSLRVDVSDVSAGARLRVVWEGEDGSGPVVLIAFSIR